MNMHQDRHAELRNLFYTLWDDVLACRTKLSANGGIFWSRTYVRCFIATVEGMTHQMRQILLYEHNKNTFHLAPEEVMLLSEERYNLDENGSTVTKKQQFLPFLAGIKLTFNIWSRWCGHATTWETMRGRDNGWNDFQQAIKIRDRLTHPKSVMDLGISAEEERQVFSAQDW
jgi:hypothetical protein